jgi:hypothetical protein
MRIVLTFFAGLAAVAALSAFGCTLDRLGTAPGVGGTPSGGGSAGMGPGAQGGVAGMGGNVAGSGGVAGEGGTGGGGVLAEWIADDPVGDPTYELPAWLSFESPSSDKTTQTGPNTLEEGFGPDVPRARRNAGPWGLSVESARTNIVTDSATWGPAPSGTWVNGDMIRTNGQAGPSPAMDAVQFESQAGTGHYSAYFDMASGPFVATTWAKGVGAAPVHSCFATCQGVLINSTNWARYISACTSSVTTFVRLETRAYGFPTDPCPLIASATTTVTYGLQIEAAGYPSSFIPTGNSPTTREAERLFIDNPDAYFPGGFYSVDIVFAPLYGATDLAMGAQHDLLFFDTNDRIFIERGAGGSRFCLASSGEPSVCTGALAWTAEEEILVEATSTGSERTLSVTIEGQVPVTPPAGTAAAAISLGSTVELLGDGSPGAQESGDLRRVTIRSP